MKHIHYILCFFLLAFMSSCNENKLTDAFAKSGILEVEEEVLQFKPQSEAKTIEIKGVIIFDVDTSKTEQWCSLVKIEDYDASNFITCYINENTGSKERETSFDLISGEQRLTMTVKQLGNSPQILLQADSTYIGRDTALLRVNIVSNVDYKLVSENQDWFTYNQEVKEDSSNYLILAVSPNNTGAERIGKITFDSDVDEADKSFVLMQSSERIDYKLSGEESVTGNIKIKIISANASSTLGEKRITLSYDEDKVSHYQSEWQDIRENPLFLEYMLESSSPLDYIQYTPFSGDTDKGFKLIEIWIKTEDVDYQLAKVHVFVNTGDAQTISLNSSFEKPVSVKFVIKSTQGAETDGMISANCAEIGFYSTSSPYANIFTDVSAGELRASVSISDILNMEDEFYRNIAYHLYYGTYNMARVRYYEPYSNIKHYKMSGTYGTLDNATGIAVEQWESVIVLAALEDKNVNLKLLNPASPSEFMLYKIDEGVNRFTMNFSGHLYIDYLTPLAAEESVHIHIAGGQYNGIYKNGDADIDFNKSKSEYIDLQGEKAHLLFRKEDLKSAPSLSGLLNKYDQLVTLQQKFIGLQKYNIGIKNRMSFVAVKEPVHMVAGRIECMVHKMDMLCNPDAMEGEILWDLLHKIGDVHTIIPMYYTKLIETIPNLYALYIEKELGVSNTSYIDKQTLYTDAFNNILLPEALLSDFNSGYNLANERIVPFWQLELYASEVLNMPDFYADMHKNLQRTPPLLQNFSTEASKLFQLDLSSFCKAWGFGSISEAPYVPAPGGLIYLTEENVELFKNPQPPVAGTYMRSGNNITVNNSENIVAFKVRHNYFPDQIFMKPQFTVEIWKSSMAVIGIGANGEEVIIEAQ